jgi:DegV family protein with EDD domain
MLHIITDSTADMPESWLEKFGIHVMPLNLIFGEQSYKDGIEIGKKDFYEKVESFGSIPKTSCPSPQEWINLVRKIANPKDTILTFHLSSKLSGSFNSARVAAEEIKDEFNLIPFDTQSGSTTVGYMCREARLLDRAEKSLQTILENLEHIRDNRTICFALDTLAYAMMSGRYKAIGSAVASVIKIKPIVYFQQNGTMKVEGLSRTLKTAVDKMFKGFSNTYGEKPLNIGVMYANDPKLAEKVVDWAKEKLNVNDIMLTNINLTLASHIGPGAIGLTAYPID